MDPPYSDRAAYQTTLEFLAEQPILSADGLVVAEHSRREGMPNAMGRLQTSRTIEQGEAALTLFRCRT
jgi:16S rRNA (guanine966-N2)-methyltransferase